MTDYDVIIVGAGTSGCALAGRLSENPDRRVLLLEAGPCYRASEDFPAEILDASSMGAAIPGHPNNWSFVGTLTPELSYSVPRGRIIGGSSSLNGTYFVRGTRQDFDRWESLGNDEWSWDKVLPFYRKLETDHDFTDPTVHGTSGPVPVKRSPSGHPITEAFSAACADLGFSADDDKNAPGDGGYGPIPMNAVDGVRVNAAMSYLLPHLDRSNLTIRGDAFVRRVLLSGGRATGVEVEHEGSTRKVFGGEIVLCAGAVKSPQLLLLSGIGPAAELAAQGIEPFVDLPGVGKRFMDHPDLWVSYQTKRRFAGAAGQPIMEAGLNFTAEGSSYAGDLEILAILAPLSQLMSGTSSLLGGMSRMARHPIALLKAMRGVSLRRAVEQAKRRGDLSFAVSLQQEDSRGDMYLVSPDPHVAPRLDYQYLTEPSDLDRLRQVVRMSGEILQSKSYRPIFETLTDPDTVTMKSDAELDRWIRTHLATAIHLASSCRMGPESDETAVVDQYCRVRGIEGLRVADTSVMPSVTSRGPNATAVMIGERVAKFYDRG